MSDSSNKGREKFYVPLRKTVEGEKERDDVKFPLILK